MKAAVRFLRLKPFAYTVELTLMTVLPSTEPPWPCDFAVAAATELLEKQTEYIEGVAERLRAIGYQAHGVAVVGTPSTYHDSATSDHLAIGSDSDGHKGPAGNYPLRARECISCCIAQDALPGAGISCMKRAAER